jgi:hypothetical protein
MIEPDYGEDVLGLDPRKEIQPQRSKPQEWTRTSVYRLVGNLPSIESYDKLIATHNAAIERAFNEGHEQGMDDEAIHWIRQKKVVLSGYKAHKQIGDTPVTELPQQQRSEPQELEQRITTYLTSGGLFNPEMANHNKVRDLLIDCRAALAAERDRGDAWELACKKLEQQMNEPKTYVTVSSGAFGKAKDLTNNQGGGDKQ